MSKLKAAYSARATARSASYLKGTSGNFRELCAGEALKYVNYQIAWEDNFIGLFEFF